MHISTFKAFLGVLDKAFSVVKKNVRIRRPFLALTYILPFLFKLHKYKVVKYFLSEVIWFKSKAYQAVSRCISPLGGQLSGTTVSNVYFVNDRLRYLLTWIIAKDTPVQDILINRLIADVRFANVSTSKIFSFMWFVRFSS
jgi:hypothetical protein